MEYPDFPFGGSSSQTELNNLMKALSTGATYGLTDQTGGAAVRLESLQQTLKSITFQMPDIMMWRMIPKVKAYSTVEQYVKELEVGDAHFYSEGGLPEEADSVFTKGYEIVKYLGSVGKISNAALSVNNLVDVKAREIANRTKGLLRKLNKTLYFGAAASNAYEFNGLLYHVVNNAASANVIDMQGKRLRPDDLNTAARVIRDNYGVPTDMFLSPLAKEYYVKELISSKYWHVNGAQPTSIGLNPNEAMTIHGPVKFNEDVFLNSADIHPTYRNQSGTVIKYNGQPPTAATSSKAPATPSIGSVTTPAGTGSVFLSGDATNYDYSITAFNQYGESAPVTSTSVAVAAGDKTVLPVTEGGGAYTATGYKVYRKLTTESTYYYCFSVAYASSPQNVEDYNFYRHNTGMAFMLDMSPDQVVAFHQLLPYFSMPLAVIDDSIRWLQKLYGTLIVYNPYKIVVIKNIGATAHS